MNVKKPPEPGGLSMTNAIGIVITDHIVAGRLEDQKLTGKLLRYPEDPSQPEDLRAIPVGGLVNKFCDFVTALAEQGNAPLDAIGIAVPGIIRHGVVEDSPNLTQMKGARLAEKVQQALSQRGINAPVRVA